MYLDPGFGSMVIQVLISAIAAGGVMRLAFRNKLKGLFRKKKKAQDEETSAIHEEEE